MVREHPYAEPCARPRQVVALALVLVLALPGVPRAADSPHRATALEAARWIRAQRISGEKGVWLADPAGPASANHSLFSGTAGVVIFFLEAARVTGDRSYLADARAGADALLDAVNRDTEKESGYYSGIAGMGFALHETYKATGTEKYRRGARRVVDLLRERAVQAGAGVEWNDYTDVALGNAGIGLFLQYAAREMNQPEARGLAMKAGARLVELGQREHGGLKWLARRGFADEMPNFAHGAAGVAYFLATLYRETKRREFLDAALAGARYLQSIAVSGAGGSLVPWRPGQQIYHLSMAHGPAGTARLFYRLHEVTGDGQWLDWVRRCARAILASGAPQKHSPGFWNNHGIAYGTAGLAEFFLELHQRTGDREYLEFARRAGGHLLAQAARDEASGGAKWFNAASSAVRGRTVAHTGLMHGAAGIGLVLLRFDAFNRQARGGIVFPDSPW